MKNFMNRLVFSILTALILLSVPIPAYAQAPDGDKIVLGGNYVLSSGEALNGELVIFGGNARLEETSRVNGDVVLIGGTLDVRGEVIGTVTAVGGSINLQSTSIITGDVNSIGSSLNKADGAVIRGNTSIQLPENIRIPDDIQLIPWLAPEGEIPVPDVRSEIRPFRNILWGIFQAFALAAMAVLAALFFEKQILRVSQAVTDQTVQSGGLGLLTAIVAPGIILLLTITIILIPVSLLGIFILGIAIITGWIAVGYEVGRRLSPKGEHAWTAPVNAGIGTLLLSLVSRAVAWIPCVGWILGAIIMIIGLGAVILSVFGTRAQDVEYSSDAISPGQPDK